MRPAHVPVVSTPLGVTGPFLACSAAGRDAKMPIKAMSTEIADGGLAIAQMGFEAGKNGCVR